MQRVVVLNADYTFIGNIDWQRSIVLLYQKKAEIIKETTKIVSNVDKSYSFIVPRVIRLLKYITTVFKNKIPYSRYNIFVRDDFECQYCGKKMERRECTVDHVLPKLYGGESTWENCVTACKKCNNLKGDTLLEYTSMNLRKKPKQPTVSDFMRKKSDMILKSIGDLW